MNKLYVRKGEHSGEYYEPKPFYSSVLTEDEVKEIEHDVSDIRSRLTLMIEMNEYNKINNKLIWLVRHSILTASISRAKGAELLGVSLIDLDDVLNNI